KIAAPIDEAELVAIRRITESGILAQPCPYVAVGEVVRVEAGPLEGLVGIVLRTKGADRLVVSVSLLMRSVSVEIDRSRVTPVRERATQVVSTVDPFVGAEKFELVCAAHGGFAKKF